MKKIILSIKGMSCSACSSSLEKYLNKQKGILDATVNLVLAQASISYDESLTIEDLNRFVKEAGFESLGEFDFKKEINKKSRDKKFLIIYGILALLTLYIAMSHMLKLPSIPYLDLMKYPFNYSLSLLILALLFIIYGLDIFKSGIKNIIHRSYNMDTLVSLGVTASFLYSLYSFYMIINGHVEHVHNLYFESCAIIIFFIKLGRYIDYQSKEKTKEALKELVQITPSMALLKTKDGEKEVTIDEVTKGDILICKPGMKVAVDGTITKGETHLDESFITGESIPNKKQVEDKVVAGSINIDGYIEYQAERIGRDSTISEIVRLVVEASNTKSHIQKVADKASSIFVPAILIIAFLTLIGYLILHHPFNEALISCVTVLVVACPCALGLATPLAIVVSEGVCAKNGLLIKSSEVLEQAHKVDTIVFDKTGTLTYGNLKISSINNYSNYQDRELLSIVYSIEAKVTHPISLAFTSYAKENNLTLQEITKLKNIEGIGVSAKVNNKDIYLGNNKLFTKLKIKNDYVKEEEQLASTGSSIVYVIEDKKVIGLIGVNDILRDDAKYTVTKLKKMGKEVIMLTGDNEITAQKIAEELNIDNVIANVLPQEKTKVIKQLKRNDKKVIMVGDGINDAPSLATADIGISVNSGTDIAADSADIILINDKLENIPTYMLISQKTLRIIKENLFWAFFYNACMIPLAIGLFKGFGFSMNPMFASFAMTFSSLTVVFNSLRLKRWKDSK